MTIRHRNDDPLDGQHLLMSSSIFPNQLVLFAEQTKSVWIGVGLEEQPGSHAVNINLDGEPNIGIHLSVDDAKELKRALKVALKNLKFREKERARDLQV